MLPWLLVLASAVCGEQERQPRPGEVPPQLARVTFADLDGVDRSPKTWADQRLVVLVFLGTECPVSNFYTSPLDALARKYRERGVAFLGVYSELEVSRGDAVTHAKEYKLSFPLLLDSKQLLARSYGIRLVPEVAVVGPSGRLIYRGRVDDRFHPESGKRRSEPRSNELIDAIEAGLDGKEPSVREAEGYGCPLAFQQ